ncbi:MAG: signal peptidase I [Mollicutes bacterium]|nr:signal peptidase I [Mollicutes bacterium]
MMIQIIEGIKDLIKYIIVIVIIILLRIYVLTTAQVVGTSMEPNLIEGNIMLVEQLSARFDKLKRFDVVAFAYSNNQPHLIKRIIGLPGETIKYVDNQFYINGEMIEENFKVIGEVEDFEIIVEEDAYFVLGDNREVSVDSREFGAITKDKIVGKAFMVVWPIKRIKIVK